MSRDSVEVKIKKMHGFRAAFVMLAVAIPLAVLAQSGGLVPCIGLDCTFCHFFTLAQRIFNFAVYIIAPAVAVIGIAWGGYYFLTAGGRPDSVSKGKKALLNTVVGFVIVYASYVIASTVIVFLTTGLIGTEAANFGFIRGVFTFQCTAESPEIPLGEAFSGGAIDIVIKETPPEVPDPADIGSDSGSNFFIAKNNTIAIDPSMLDELNLAANQARENGFELLITDGIRTVAEQQALAAQNCDLAKSTTKCSRKPGRPDTCIPKDTDGAGGIDGLNCKHIVGRAVDVKGLASDGVTRCSNCENSIIQVMQDQGFCVLKKEAWHFELESTLGNREQFFDCG